MPISLDHPGLLHILHVGRNDDSGYFYYVMELGDDESSGPTIDPATYSPRDLSKELRLRTRFAVLHSLEWFIPLADALEYLHRQGLIHRDIKPSNIIFVRSIPKLADIGLVTEAAGNTSLVYTPGYIPPEGPGPRSANVFAFGKVMCEACTGKDRNAYPSLPEDMTDEAEAKQVLAFLDIVNNACEPHPQAGYSSMAELRTDLLRLQSKFKPAQ